MTALSTLTRDRTRRMVVDELRRLLPESCCWPGQMHIIPFGLATLDAHLPQRGLAFGAMHEVVPESEGDMTAACGFVMALLGRLPQQSRLLFAMPARGFAQYGHLYGHGLRGFGLDPGRVILVEMPDAKQTLWVIEEALRSGVLTAVIGAVEELDLRTSQRLQFAARDSGVPLMLIRPARTLEASAATTRWRVGTAEAARDRFGLIDRWRWHLTLDRCRNGRRGDWLVEYDHVAHRFSLAPALADPALSRHAGTQALARTG